MIRRLLAALITLAALFAGALPAQAAPYQRTHLGSAASSAERASFGCGSGTGVENVRTFLLYHNGHYVIAKAGTVKHQNRIVDVCRFLHQRPVAVRAPIPTPDPCPMGVECGKP